MELLYALTSRGRDRQSLGAVEFVTVSANKGRRGRMRIFCAVLLLTAALIVTLPVFSCGDEIESPEPSLESAQEKAESAEDKAAALAAQTQLRNAQSAQEVYFTENMKYAPSLAELKTVDARLSPRIVVVKGDSNGYEMSIEASDSAGTKFILRKTGSRIERVDSEGNSW